MESTVHGKMQNGEGEVVHGVTVNCAASLSPN